MLLAQFSDLHIQADSSNEDFVATEACLQAAVAHLNTLSPSPDALLITGDLVDNGLAADYARLRACLARLNMPVYVQPGNHDDRIELCRAFADVDYLPAPGAFIQYAVEHLPVRLLVLDTLIPGQVEGALCGERLAWLAARLAEQPNRPTIVALHHPPFDTGLQGMDGIGLGEGREALAELVAAHPQIERVLCGHLHRSIQRRWQGTLASVCPSVTHALYLDLGGQGLIGKTLEPPAYQLHQWTASGGLVSHLVYVGEFPTRMLQL